MAQARLHVPLTVLLMLVAAAVAGSLLLGGSPAPSQPGAAPLTVQEPVVRPTTPIRGDSGPLLVVFGDFQCQACAEFTATLEQVRAAGVPFRVAWKDLPLPSHLQSFGAAVAARCAQRQGFFWAFHDRLYATQAELGSEQLLSIAAELGLDPEPFRECLGEPAAAALVQSDVAEAAAVGVDGTPYIFVGQVRFNRAMTADELTQALAGA